MGGAGDEDDLVLRLAVRRAAVAVDVVAVVALLDALVDDPVAADRVGALVGALVGVDVVAVVALLAGLDLAVAALLADALRRAAVVVLGVAVVAALL